MEVMNEIMERSIAGEIQPAVTGVLKKRGMAGGTLSKYNLHEKITHGLRKRMQEIEFDILQQVNEQINQMVTEILQEVEKIPKKTDEFVNDEKYNDKIKSSTDILPSKHFVHRNSLLTDLYEIKHIRTVYNIFLVILIILCINTGIQDIWKTGTPTLGIVTIMKGFAKFPIVIRTWLLMKGCTLGIYAAFDIWANKRFDFAPNSLARKAWDYSWLVAFIFYQIMFMILPTKEVLDEDLAIASSVVVLMEQIRMMMKSYAFVRSVAPRFLSYKPHAESKMPKLPDFSHFLYFMFAPTLVYKESYPRTRKIRWNFVLYHYAEVLMSLFFVAYIFEYFVIPVYVDFGKQPIELLPLCLQIMGTAMAGILSFVLGFYCLLHSWMNAFAELLQFADRMFYKDWWNATSYTAFYRSWNVVVHDWLYTYIHKDLYEIVMPRNKKLSLFAVFTISAIFHEYILTFAFRFFLPGMLFVFGVVGQLIIFNGNRSGNTVLWFTLCSGNGMLVSFYAMEYFARINCPSSYSNDIMDMFVPRLLACYKKFEI